MAELGKLKKVELRDVWAKEDKDFTPWLAHEQNIDLLGDTIGLDLEVESVEKNVGPFRADILCKDQASQDWVLIENQLEITDHTHLGQLMTYAAGLDAVTIVWIAEKFTEEHRAALDWLNDKTSTDVNFFGLEIELWKVDSSLAAPKFNVVAKPNDWSRTVKKVTDGEYSDLQQLQLEYWTAFQNTAEDICTKITPPKPAPYHFRQLKTGSGGFTIEISCISKRKHINVCLYISTTDAKDAKAYFHLLYDDKSEIEKKIGRELNWWELPEKKGCYICLN